MLGERADDLWKIDEEMRSVFRTVQRAVNRLNFVTASSVQAQVVTSGERSATRALERTVA